MTGKNVVISIIFFRNLCHKAYLALSFVLGQPGYLSVVLVGLAISCCCGPDCVVVLNECDNYVMCLSRNFRSTKSS